MRWEEGVVLDVQVPQCIDKGFYPVHHPHHQVPSIDGLAKVNKRQCECCTIKIEIEKSKWHTIYNVKFINNY